MNNGKAKLHNHNSEMWFKRQVTKVDNAKNDTRETERLERQECPNCYYLDSGWGGSAMTSWECALCDHTETHGSTATPVLCKICAEREDRCTRCGDKMFSPSA